MKRTRKPPRLFGTVIPAKRYEKKILKRIPLVGEREFLAGLYQKDGDTYVRPDDLPKKDTAHLRRLAKAVKHNRGLLQPVKLGLLAAIAGASLVFLLFFLSPILSRTIERGLESAFVARSDLAGFSIRPFDPGLSFDSLVVADRNRPMYNLFEIHSVRVQLDLGQLLRGRVVIRDLDAGELRFATGRSESGALPDTHPARRAASADRQETRSTLREDAAGLVQDGVDQLLSLDVEQIVAAELSRLTTPGVVDEQITSIRAEITDAREQIRDVQEDLASFRRDSQRLLSTDVRSIRSVDQLVSLYEETDAVARDAQAITSQVAAVSADVGESQARVTAAVEAITAAVQRDLSGIQERIPSASDVVAGPVAAFVEPHLFAIVEPYRDTIDTVLNAVRWLQARSADSDSAAQPGRQGRTVTFPSREYPRFLLERAAAGAAIASIQYSAELTSLSSNPDMMPEPTRARYQQQWNGRGAHVHAAFDTRTNATTPFDLDVLLERQPLTFTIPNAPFSFTGLAGSFDLTAEARLIEDNGSLGEELAAFLSVVPDELSFSSDGLIVQRVRSVIERAGSIDITIRAPAARGEAAVETNLDGPIRDEIAAFLAEQRDEILAQVEAAVRREIDEQRARYEQELEQIVALYAEIEGYVAEARTLADQVREQRNAIDARIAGLRDELEDRARAEVEAARAEAERRAREEAEAAAREAEGRVREEAGRIIDSIRSPF